MIKNLIYQKTWSEAIRPLKDMPLDEWAAMYRVLPKVGSPEPGKWRNERTPYLVDIMRSLNPYNSIKRVVIIKGVQIGGTECGNNWIGQVIHQHPAPFLIVQPTVEIAKKWSKQRLAPMIIETPVLRDKLKDPRERDSGNTILTKEFPGGVLFGVGANSAASLRSMPICNAMMDEIDAYPVDVDGEGDVIELVRKRMSNYRNSKELLISTPTDKETSRIEREFNLTDQCYYHVPCPFCGTFQKITWSSIVWENGDPTTTKMKCEKCEKKIDEYHKTKMLAGGKWIATHPERSHLYRGFHVSSLYSPIGWRSWVECVEEFLTASKDASKLKTFVNTVLGETWEEEGDRLDWEVLFNRRETYKHRVPKGVMVLTGGVDIQHDRLEAEIIGWGLGEESWSIDHEIIWGSPADKQTWEDLDDYLAQPFMHEYGESMRLAAVGLDTAGGFEKDAYRYAKRNATRNIFAFKGASVAGKPIVSKPSRTSKLDINLYTIGTDTAKNTIRSYLMKDRPGPGYAHYPITYDEEYFRQLTAEKLVTKYKNGFPYKAWIPIRKRNEILDLRVYSLAALSLLNVNWVLLAQRFNEMREALKEDDPEPELELQPEEDIDAPDFTTKKSKRVSRNSHKRGGFAKSF